MNEVLQTLLSHRSIRAYQNKPVEADRLEQIVKAVQAAPNWVNLQHTSIIVVRNQERRKIWGTLRRPTSYRTGSSFSGVLRGFLPYLAGLQGKRSGV